ncbi:hypothetical protein GGI25_005987 [Coemansia spiralis]|uniref:G protein-coupled receptor n=2 Tax=Coemansia TaxID=4863 RepID=A0A9W8G1W1_9FUNG|nr:hypothetical protein EDC05_006428 [Coemansia umbellata]KAJ2618626.1 hypothetical protein GGI26_006459 [Coemansia sp. RSA 1358]KAJ2669989.1 hypothetical protein GGI25_005987 [Coemansia spiralis]
MSVAGYIQRRFDMNCGEYYGLTAAILAFAFSHPVFANTGIYSAICFTLIPSAALIAVAMAAVCTSKAMRSGSRICVLRLNDSEDIEATVDISEYVGTNDIDGIQVQERKELSDKAKKRIRSVCLRILAYPLIPIVTQIWILATNMTPTAPMWLYVMANIIPATQGMLNFLAFIANPAWDDHRKKLFAKCRQIRRNKVATSSTGSEIGFSRLAEEGTICSTPFSSTKFDDEKFEYK